MLFADDPVLCAKSAADLQKLLNGLEQVKFLCPHVAAPKFIMGWTRKSYSLLKHVKGISQWDLHFTTNRSRDQWVDCTTNFVICPWSKNSEKTSPRYLYLSTTKISESPQWNLNCVRSTLGPWWKWTTSVFWELTWSFHLWHHTFKMSKISWISCSVSAIKQYVISIKQVSTEPVSFILHI